MYYDITLCKVTPGKLRLCMTFMCYKLMAIAAGIMLAACLSSLRERQVPMLSTKHQYQYSLPQIIPGQHATFWGGSLQRFPSMWDFLSSQL